MFPSAQTACPHNSMSDELSIFRRGGTAPACTTARVWSEVPLAKLINAQTASYCRVVLQNSNQNSKIINQIRNLLPNWHYEFLLNNSLRIGLVDVNRT